MAEREVIPPGNYINDLGRQTFPSAHTDHKDVSAALANQLSLGAALVYDNINAASSSDSLDNIARAVWHSWGKGALTDDEATFLNVAIDRRRSITFHRPSRNGAGPAGAVGGLLGRIDSRFKPRPARRRLTDEARTKRRHRKRMLGGSSAMPDTMRHHYTEGERAVMCIVAGQVKRQGICDLSIDEIADRAGVGRTTVQNAMHEARRLSHVKITERRQRGAKNLTNVVEIISAEWRDWIKRGPSAARGTGSKGFTNVNTTKITDIKNKDATDEERLRRGTAPPPTWWRGT
jgi:hypothetical protein